MSARATKTTRSKSKPARKRAPRRAPAEYTVCIATRNDPELQATVDHLANEINAPRVAVGQDANAVGPQRVRHVLIAQAETPVVVVTDGHMRFRAETLQALADYAAANPSHVACARCYHAAPYWNAAGPYCGAQQHWRSEEPGGQFWPLPAKWRTDTGTGPIGAVMGACYAFTRDWYMDGLRAPFEHGTGWGYDEEVLSALTWICGGEIHLLPVDCAHLYQARSTYQPQPGEAIGIWANRMRLLNLLPLPNEERKELHHWTSKTQVVRQHAKEIMQLAAIPLDKADYYATKASGYTAWRSRWVVDTAETSESRDARMQRDITASGVAQEAGESLAGCWLRSKGSTAQAPPQPVTPAKPRANYGADENPRKCPKCGSQSSKVKSTWTGTYPPRVMRRRVCDDCARLYCTVQLT